MNILKIHSVTQQKVIAFSFTPFSSAITAACRCKNASQQNALDRYVGVSSLNWMDKWVAGEHIGGLQPQLV